MSLSQTLWRSLYFTVKTHVGYQLNIMIRYCLSGHNKSINEQNKSRMYLECL
uniref:Uncharacterized protein n=1 Tax=Anguilla anguilla TaxID=7936 RepID=A0A0E9R8Y6_ANGAN